MNLYAVKVHCRRQGWSWVIGQCVKGNESSVYARKLVVSVSHSMPRKRVSPFQGLEIIGAIKL